MMSAAIGQSELDCQRRRDHPTWIVNGTPIYG